MRVLVRPVYSDYLDNRLFRREHEYAPHWMEPYLRLRELAAESGIEIATWDTCPLDSADAIVFQDLPARPEEVKLARQAAPRAKFLLQLIESPLGRPHNFVSENHTHFDAVLTYNHHLCDEQRYFRYYLPLGLPDEPVACPSFAERKPLVLMNTNRPVGFGEFRRSGLAGLPRFGPLLSGWRVPLSKWLRQYDGELYSRRRRLARLAEAQFPNLLDIYGHGWLGERMGWIHRFVRNRRFANARGKCASKFQTLPNYRFCLAFENMVADVGYLSEKIFDSLLAGAVPIYLGDERIADLVDPACFVDARRFQSDHELLEYARDCPEPEWQHLREAGQRYIRSEAFVRFLPQAFARRFLEIIERVAGNNVRRIPIPFRQEQGRG